MTLPEDHAAIQAIHAAADARTKAANKLADDAASAANKAKDQATLSLNRTADQFAQGNYAEIDARTAERLIAERRAAAKIASTALHDAME
jgi:hypothetical protein